MVRGGGERRVASVASLHVGCVDGFTGGTPYTYGKTNPFNRHTHAHSNTNVHGDLGRLSVASCPWVGHGTTTPSPTSTS